MSASIGAISDSASRIKLGTGKNEIEKDSIEINKLVSAAMDGEWLLVWEILGEPQRPRKGYLINVIPESRRWGILHQAVYWNNPDILKKVLAYKSCDYEIPTKPCTFDNQEKGVKRPLEIARMYSYSNMSQILEANSQSLINQGLETFQACNKAGELRGFQLLSITIAAYKQAFHPKSIDPNRSLFDVMQNIFNDVNTSDDRWKVIKEKVCEAVEGVCDTTHSNILASTTRQSFYSAIIRTYTEVSGSKLYTYLNTAMRRQKEADYRPTARDLALGPYILIYEILLLYWEELRKEPGKTFRRMLVSDSDLREYQVGKKFMWVSFVSSSSKIEKAVVNPTCETSGDNVICFTIDNSTPCIWQPRNIEAYAQYIENERTYPAGANFEVMTRKQSNEGLNIDLKLLSVGPISDSPSRIKLGTGKNEIEKDSIEINKLVAAAENGEWLLVWEILGEPKRPRKGYFINVIPESRRWGVLHQAVYWNNPGILKKVLAYESCDCKIRTKPCTFDNQEKGVKSPLEIAQIYSYNKMSQILEEANSQSLIYQGLETFQAYNKSGSGELRGLQLLSITIAAYKQAFHPKSIEQNISLLHVMQNIFYDVNTSDERWKAIKDKVCEAVEGVCYKTYRYILASTTRKGFYSAIIKTYTEERDSKLYTYLNTDMRRQKEADYRPTATYLALGPYILMYEILLLYWEELRKEPGRTFRRMLLSDFDLREYHVGKKFIWVSFVSSSSRINNAEGFPTCKTSGDNVVIFTIDNSTPCIWQPRNIEAYAQYPEYERTYPAGAHFEVMARMQDNAGFNIHLKLLMG